MSRRNLPLISVAMCTYNGATYLEPQLDSILDQSYSNIEVIIVDDCSTDSTLEILQRYQRIDPRIRIIQNESTLGFVKNFERALSECKGPYIALADQDDVWMNEKLEVLAKEIGDNLLIYSRVNLIDEAGNAISGRFPRVNRLQGNCALSLIPANCVTGHTCLIDRKLVEMALPFPQGLFSHDQWLALAAAGTGKLKASTHTLSFYRIHNNNTLAGNKSKKIEEKTQKYKRKLNKIFTLAQAASQRSILKSGDQEKLEEFLALLQKNFSCFYNWELSSFLKANSKEFLQLYTNPDRARRKLCQGLFSAKMQGYLKRAK